MLTPQQVLDFEARWSAHTGRKEATIVSELHVTPVRYYQLLGRVARSLDGQAHDPITARRVRERLDRAHILPTLDPSRPV